MATNSNYMQEDKIINKTTISGNNNTNNYNYGPYIEYYNNKNNQETNTAMLYVNEPPHHTATPYYNTQTHFQQYNYPSTIAVTNPNTNFTQYYTNFKWRSPANMQTYEFFDYICVIDFEATCIERGTDFPHEIIEFPIVLINMKNMKIEDCFQLYVRPVINPKLSTYCMNLTGITQEQVDNADTFPEVMKKVKDWFQSKQLGTKYRFAVATDGPWDFEKFLNLQCFYSNILYPYWASRWIDVRQLFSDWNGQRKCCIDRMLHYFGYSFEGKPHCGLDDARNIARILLKLVENGCPISFNGQIRKCYCSVDKYPYSTMFNGFIDC